MNWKKTDYNEWINLDYFNCIEVVYDNELEAFRARAECSNDRVYLSDHKSREECESWLDYFMKN